MQGGMGLVIYNVKFHMFHIHTLSMRINVGRNGTSYLQRKVPYVPYSHIKYENECREEWD